MKVTMYHQNGKVVQVEAVDAKEMERLGKGAWSRAPFQEKKLRKATADSSATPTPAAEETTAEAKPKTAPKGK